MIRNALLAIICFATFFAAAGCKPGTCDKNLLPGLWSSATYTVAIAEDLSFESAGAPNLAQIDVTGTMTADGCDLYITDIGGEQLPCPEEQVGHYSFTVSATQLRLTVIDDTCEGRRTALNGTSLTRTE